jgi:putative iron-regulated protein
VLDTYADNAAANYADSLTAAQALQNNVTTLIEALSAATLQAARTAWLAARVPYQQTEVFRFGNPIVDDGEGRGNAWPLDEGLIDYVDRTYGGPTDENQLAALNAIAIPVFTLLGQEIDATEITPELLQDTLHEADGIEANVATGYHAIEFLLWGQDLNGHGDGAGNRPSPTTPKARIAPAAIAIGARVTSRRRPSFSSSIWTGWPRNGPTAGTPARR